MGNLRSVINAVSFVGGDVTVASQPKELDDSGWLILPGVGSFRRAMEQLRANGFDDALSELVVQRQMPILGICLGMQLMAQRGCEDGETKGLGLIDCEVDRFAFDRMEFPNLKVPHVGFDAVTPRQGARLFAGLGEQVDFYFTHSYRMQCVQSDAVAASCWHGETFVAAIERDNIAATQFHPEKSQTNGLQLLRNFLGRF